MKQFKKAVLATIILGAVFIAPSSFAGNPMEKLGRGIANVAFSPLELLIQPYDVMHEKGNVAALTYGVIKGVVWTVSRIGVGVIDIITFPMPLPGCTDDPYQSGWGYGPMMRPAWVVDEEHNAFNFFYQDEAISR
jgi:putative exosortase-associated protein (TIGR04073 family)